METKKKSRDIGQGLQSGGVNLLLKHHNARKDTHLKVGSRKERGGV